MSTIWESFAPKTEEVVPTTHGWVLNATWLLSGVPLLGIGWPTACFICLTVACYLTVFRLIRWNRATRHRLEENLDRLVTMKQFSDLTDQHQRVRTQIDRLKDEAKTLLKTVASAERSLLPERLRLRDLQEQQEREQQQARHKLPSAMQQQQQQPRRRRPAAVQRLRQRPHATSSAPTSLPATAHARCEAAPAPAAASATAAVNAATAAAGELATGASAGNGCQPPPPEE